VALSWDRLLDRTGPRLHILWSEHKGPPVRVTGRKGFGTRLICEGLAYELEGEVKLDFDPAGVRCAIDVPLSRQEDAL
jgi:two-component sensor histidine kinase